MPRKNHPDPGGVFPSDDHRRVLGHLGTRATEGYEVGELLERMWPDDSTSFEEERELLEVLEELQADGLATESARGAWYMTKAGFDAITGPVAEEV